MHIAIMTCANYKYRDATNVLKEQQRTLTVKNQAHVNYDSSKSHNNVILARDPVLDTEKSFKAYLKRYRENNNIEGRFNIDTSCDRNATKVLCSFIMSGSQELISSMTRAEQVEYFRHGLKFLQAEYPTFHLVDARVHYDEQGLPHMHASFLPIHIDGDGRKSFNVTKHQKGKDYFRGFQDRFYSFMQELYPEKNLQRYKPERDHTHKLTVREYKENQDFKKKLREEHSALLSYQKELQHAEQQLQKRMEQTREIEAYNHEIDAYCRELGLTYTDYMSQCFWADRGMAQYPIPEQHNPDRSRSIEPEK